MQLIVVILTITNVFLMTESCDKSEPGCELKPSIKLLKCCQFGMVLDKDLYSNETIRENGTVCQQSTENFNPPVYDGLTVLNQSVKKLFNITIQLIHCEGQMWLASEYTENYTLQKDGRLYVNASEKDFFVDPKDYCIDIFKTDGTNPQLDALVCITDPEGPVSENSLSTGICMLVSCIFILLTMSVYIYISKYKKLHEKIFIVYLTCLFVAFLLFGSMQLMQRYKTHTMVRCLSLTFLIYFSYLSTFFWLNVMCYDMWRNFIWPRNPMKSRKSVRSKFLVYAIPGFGIPTILSILLICLEFSDLTDQNLLPMIRANFNNNRNCFLHGRTLLWYLYVPITIPCVVNCMFFMHILIHIIMSVKQTSAFKSKESTRHGDQSQQQPLFYGVRLFILMGINWILESLGAYYQHKNWIYVDYYNGVIGVIIFLAFVCRRDIYLKLKDKFLTGRGNASSRQNTRTTTNTSETVEYSTNK